MKMKQKFFIGFAALLIAAMFTMAGCDTGNGGGGGGDGFVPVTDITDVLKTALVNSPYPLIGTVVPADATNKTITWSGDGVNLTSGDFTATTAKTYTVTATIANGASASSPYTKTFIITAYADNATNYIALAQGVWTRGPIKEGASTYTLKMVITGANWVMSAILPNSTELPQEKGIIISVDATHYNVQTTHKYEGSSWVPKYGSDAGTYTLSNGNNTLTLTSTDTNSKANGIWTKQ